MALEMIDILYVQWDIGWRGEWWFLFVAKLEFTKNDRQFVWKKQITILDRGSSAFKANLEPQSDFESKKLIDSMIAFAQMT